MLPYQPFRVAQVLQGVAQDGYDDARGPKDGDGAGAEQDDRGALPHAERKVWAGHYEGQGEDHGSQEQGLKEGAQ